MAVKVVSSHVLNIYLVNLRIRNSINNGHFADTLKIYSSMLHNSNVHGNSFTFPLLFKACAALTSLRDGTMLHAHVLELGFVHDIFVQTSLLDMYSKCSCLVSARNVFDEMLSRNVISWNTMISAYCRGFRVMEAIKLLKEMWVLGFELSASTFISVVAACANLQLGLSMHCCIFKLGLLQCEIPLANSLMNMYVKFGFINGARSVFDTMDERSILSWTTIIGGYVNVGNVGEAFSLFNRMRKVEGVSQDMVLFIKIISGCVQAGNLPLASSIHSLVLKCGYDGEDLMHNLVLNMYAKCGDIGSAQRVFEMVDEKCIFLWTSMIAAYTQFGYPAEALDLFKRLLRTGLKPHEATFATILSACADLGSPSLGKEIEHYVKINGLASNRQVQTSLIHMYCKCGIVEKAEEVFVEVLHKDLAVWSSMINGYAIHGMGNEALNLFHQMQITESFSLDHVVFTSILLACSHSGLVEDGLKYFKDMKRVYGIEPSIEHYTCLVDLLGRAGHFDLALKTIQEIPVQVQAQVWAPLLSACRKYRNVDLGEYIARKLLELNPGNTSNYVLMANLYTSGGKWKEAAITRSMLRNRGLVKEPGWSQIEINGYIHVFVAGDRSHNRSADIYKKLDELNIKLKEAGYFAEIDMVMHDLENEEKEEALKVHSERLAVAWGIISTDLGTTLTIIKSLQTCVDCHSFLKFTSKVTGRHLIRLKKDVINWEVKHTFRENNHLADRLAKAGVRRTQDLIEVLD
ncbi:Pentatricopeptide repeat superfamily protein, putative [Theobroma cacao]|uniref:Pentatricopeptide repeat superfamily protein, putative n=1 Tax=Theobroma cacao TaxID=3641 RepID=A0A061F704_THECC|nr:Pentatricopeptide repeat superfamily protein, putative [Theobroma cacao]